MHAQTAAVYCIVRARDEEHALQRIESTLQSLGLWAAVAATAGAADRIVPVVGDLARPLLGLGLAEFKALAGELDAIIHAGAKVSFFIIIIFWIVFRLFCSVFCL
jgi:thioester reductase-like protein